MNYFVGTGEHWIFLEACPACGNADKARSEVLNQREYRFGGEIIQIPDRGIRLVQCRICGLLYKDVLPSPRFLAEVFARRAEDYWSNSYDFRNEARTVLRLACNKSFDVIDIGTADGSLLKALTCTGMRGRLSALDVMMYAGSERWISGEFVHGFVDSQHLAWAGKPYDVATMLDIAEHLYDPMKAFANLRHLVKPGGIIIVETGDSDSFWPQKFGPENWWYTSFFEHHVFWSRQSLEHIAERYGFRTLEFSRKRHKEETPAAVWHNIIWMVKSGIYWLTPVGHYSLAKILGKKGRSPWAPFTRDHSRDHFRVVLQKVATDEERDEI